MAGGFASGFMFGLIGWGVGYLIVANQDTDIPRRYVSGLEISQRFNFEDGYKEYIEKTRKRKFNTGAGLGLGTLLVIVLAAAASSGP